MIGILGGMGTQAGLDFCNKLAILNRGKIDFQNLPQPVNQQLEESPYILFDPLGNGILIYDSSLPSGELLKDLKKVLQNSKIG